MNRYYVKVGYSEKGPFTLEELRNRKIGSSEFLRLENSDVWFEANELPELKTNSFGFVKILKYLGMTSLLVIIIFGANILYQNLSAKEGFNNSELESEILVPPQIDYDITQHKKKFLNELFKDCNLSGKKKTLVSACNYTNSTLRNLAVNLAGKSSGKYNLGQVCEIFDYCTSQWKYVNDPKTDEVIEYASNTISNGLNGDCDDFAVLVCSMVLSIGGEARINYAYGKEGGHAFTEVNIGKTNIEEIESYISKRYKSVYSHDGVWTRTDSDGNKWLNLDWFAKHPGGKYFDYLNGTTFYIIQQYCTDFSK